MVIMSSAPPFPRNSPVSGKDTTNARRVSHLFLLMLVANYSINPRTAGHPRTAKALQHAPASNSSLGQETHGQAVSRTSPDRKGAMDFKSGSCRCDPKLGHAYVSSSNRTEPRQSCDTSVGRRILGPMTRPRTSIPPNTDFVERPEQTGMFVNGQLVAIAADVQPRRRFDPIRNFTFGLGDRSHRCARNVKFCITSTACATVTCAQSGQ